MISFYLYVYLSIILFVIGVCGFLIRRHAVVMLMCIELMLNAVMLLLVSASVRHTDLSAQIFVLFIMIIAAAEVCIGLAIIAMAFRKKDSVDVDHYSALKG